MKKFSEIVAQIKEDKKTMEILPTGLIGLDFVLEGGFIKKELVLLGGRTGGGKSLMAGTIFWNMVKNGNKCAYFSLEISNQMLGARMMGAKADISPTRLMIAELAKNEEVAMDKADAEISTFDELMDFYDDIYIYEQLEKFIKAGGYDFVVIDFIQNIMSGHKDEYERLSQVALNLQKLAKLSNVCILAISQLSNLMAKDKKATDIVEYKGSGAIGHAADLAFFIEAGRAGEGSLSLRLRKNRRGISGTSISFMIKQPGGRIIELS